MSLIGDSPPWRGSLLNVYDLIREAIFRAWPDCRARIQTAPTYITSPTAKRKNRQKLEDPITRDLVRRLKQDIKIRGLLHIESQRELIEPSLNLDPDPKGYLDIAIVFFVNLDEVCLTLECKRLNVVRSQGKGRTTLARQYVEKGMMRFINGQYSNDCSVGGMIGYVMDGDVTAAQNAVISEIVKNVSALLCTPADIQILNHPDYFSTTHSRTPINIELRHQLLSAN